MEVEIVEQEGGEVIVVACRAGERVTNLGVEKNGTAAGVYPECGTNTTALAARRGRKAGSWRRALVVALVPARNNGVGFGGK